MVEEGTVTIALMTQQIIVSSNTGVLTHVGGCNAEWWKKELVERWRQETRDNCTDDSTIAVYIENEKHLSETYPSVAVNEYSSQQ